MTVLAPLNPSTSRARPAEELISGPTTKELNQAQLNQATLGEHGTTLPIMTSM